MRLYNCIKKIWLVSSHSKYNRVGLKGSRFMNHESIFWSCELKICKIPIFHKWFFPKFNFKITCTDDICLPLCLKLNEWGLTMKEKPINYEVIHSNENYQNFLKKTIFFSEFQPSINSFDNFCKTFFRHMAV